MEWTAQVLRYCERGTDASLWAEPLNAMTNAGFVVVGGLALARFAMASQPAHNKAMGLLLAGNVVAIGVGSFLFHTFATQWAQVADTAPIGLFMVVYLGFALRTLLGLSWRMTGLGLTGFAVAMAAVANIDCRVLAAGLEGGSPGRCFNGTLGYAPALAALAGVAYALRSRDQAAGSKLLAAAAVLLVSMVLRSIDLAVCDVTRIGGYTLGTHALWHILNAVALHLMLRAVENVDRRRGGE